MYVTDGCVSSPVEGNIDWPPVAQTQPPVEEYKSQESLIDFLIKMNIIMIYEKIIYMHMGLLIM